MNKEKQDKIIADYIRYTTGETSQDDQEVIQTFGGDTSNEIIVDFENGKYLYKSVDSAITVYIVIDTDNLANSYGNEPLNH